MNIKVRPNHGLYIQSLRRMSPEARLMKAFELTEFSRQLFRQGLRRRFPEQTESELSRIYVERLIRCHNRNY
jgi:hypothetical protein